MKNQVMLVFHTPLGKTFVSVDTYAKDGVAHAKAVQAAREELRRLYGEKSGHWFETVADTPANRAKYDGEQV